MSEAASCDLYEVIDMYNAMIRLYFNENPDTLTDEDFATRVRELNWLSNEGFLRSKQK